MWKNIFLGITIVTTIILFMVSLFLGYKWYDCSRKLTISKNASSVKDEIIAEKEELIKEQEITIKKQEKIIIEKDETIKNNKQNLGNAYTDVRQMRLDNEVENNPTGHYNSTSTNTQDYTHSYTPEEDGYICSYSNKRELTQADVSNKSDWILTLMRNEIYARHGRPFQDAEIKAHFVSKKWYKVDNNYKDNALSRIEIYNIDFIMKQQK